MLNAVKLLSVAVLFAICASYNAIAAGAQPETGTHAPLILSINVEGNHNVEKEAVLAKMDSRVGETLSRRQLSRDVRRLYKSGFFSDISFTGDRTSRGVHLVCHVKEYPLIAKVEMEGNSEFPLKDLQLKMKLKPGRIYSPMYRKSDRNLLRKGYLKKGYYQVGIDFIPHKRKDGRINLLIRVHEGKITRINRIHMIGNKAFSDATLLGQIASRQSGLFAWFSDRDIFDQKRFGADSQLLQQYYLNHGYLDMKFNSKQITMEADKKSFSLTFSIHEGPRYRVSKIGLQGDLVPDRDTLQKLVAMKAGDIYSLDKMRKTITAITDRVGDEGYAFASVTPQLNRNLDDHTVAITFDIEKGREVYIERIEISGNDKTDDNVIRRQLVQSEGSRYAGSQIEHGKEALKRAPYLSDTRISFPKGTADNKVDMKVDVTEKKSGTISAGVGFSQREKVILNAKIAEKNLFGKGYQADLNGQVGKITQNITGSLTDPFFLDSNVSATINGFRTKTSSQTFANYDTSSFGGGLGFGIPITHYITYNINYQFNSTNLSTIPLNNPSLFQKAQLGSQTTSEFTQSITWDSRDRFTDTTSGHVDSLSISVAGLGGTNKFVESGASSKWYFPFGKAQNIVLNPSIRFNAIRAFSGTSIPLYRRYSLGGIGSLRGFDTFGVTIRDPLTGDPVGGDNQVTASLNLFFPLPYVETSGIRGLIFTDAGNVWGSASAVVPNTPPINVHEPFALSRARVTAGFGIEWLSPIGPVGLSWAVPIRSQPQDLQKSFEFAIGSTF